jgi:uncharacterized protein YggT (Ycf19 family)
MGLIDSILNVVCLLLWLNWRSIPRATPEKAPAVSLAATLKKAGPGRAFRWASLAFLAALLAGRGVFYWNVGAALNWTPSLRLGVVSLPFRSDQFGRIMLFSVLSFILVLAIAYAWILLISAINRRVPPDEPIQRLIRMQLGWVDRWPVVLKLAAPVVGAALLWGLGSPGLVQLGLLPAPASTTHLWKQALLLGLTSLLSWKFLLLGICALYMLNSYVYFGRSSFWSYVNLTGANLLRPLQRWPVCMGKVDFSPLLAIALVLWASHWAAQWLQRLFHRLPL